MMAARKILGTALAICTIGLAAALSSTAHAQGMTGVPLPNTGKAPANAKPTITGNPSRMLVAGSYYDFRPSASDPDSAQLTFAINKKPRWANFDASTGRLYGTPSAIDVGKIKGIQISVSDGVNRKGLTKFGIKVVRGVAPTISGAPATTATEGQPYQFQPSASDGDQQKLQFAIVNKPSWASFDSVTGRLHGTPPAGSAGTYSGIADIGDRRRDHCRPCAVCDHRGEGCVAPRPPRRELAPTIGGTPPTSVQVGQTYDFTPSASDKDGDALAFSSVNVPEWLTFDRATGRLSGKPQSGQEATYSGLVISVTDGTADRVPRSVLGHGGAGTDQQVAGAECRAVDQRHAADQRHRRQGLRVPADGVRRERRCAHLQRRQRAAVADDRLRHRPARAAPRPRVRPAPTAAS